MAAAAAAGVERISKIVLTRAPFNCFGRYLGMSVRKICCIGADDLGGPFSCVVAYKCPDIQVCVVDQSEETIMKWNSGTVPVPGKKLEEILKKCLEKNLFFSCEAEQAIAEADLIFVCVNTQMKPVGLSKGKAANLKLLEDAARLIAKTAKTSKIVVEKSSVPFRAAETLASILRANAQPGVTFSVLSNPEFYSKETLVQDLLKPEKVLIGCEKTPEGLDAMQELMSVYQNWVPSNLILTSDTWSTELAKLAANAFLAQRISSINSLSEVCEVTNADVSEVANAIGMDSRIGTKGLEASLGFGGANLLKDVHSIVYMCESLKLPRVATYWQKVIDLNEYQKKRFTRKIIEGLFNSVAEKQIAILGFSCKKNTTETAESPAIFVCKTLLQEGARLKIYDPAVPKTQIMQDLKGACDPKIDLESTVTVLEDPYLAAEGSHGLVVCTNWEEFKELDFFKLYNDMMKPAFICDGWKILPHQELMQIGFNVQTIGKNLTTASSSTFDPN